LHIFIYFLLLCGIGFFVYRFYIENHFIPISEILSDPIKYQGKEVAVKGTIIDAKYKVSKWGKEYAVYVLSDGTGAIKIFAYHDPDDIDIYNWGVGDKVEVLGKYYWVRYVGPYVFLMKLMLNQLDTIVKYGKKLIKN